MTFTTLVRAGLRAVSFAAAGLGAIMFAASAMAQAPAASSSKSWMEPQLLAAAKKEGLLTVYGSMNEREALPLLKIFETDTGIKTQYVRNSDTGLMARILVEARANKESWDVLQTTTVSKMPPEFFAQVNLPEAEHLMPEARDKDHRWYGVYANYNSPGYNTKLVQASELPKTYEDFLKHKEWAGKVAIDYTDREWLRAMYEYYGKDKGEKLVKDLIKTLKVATTKGHLALARSVGAGEYAIELNNYTNLIVNVKLGGAPTNFWALDPVVVFFGQVGVNAKAPHPNAARLFANFVLSQEGQTQLTTHGRIPTRPDVETNPPGVLKAFAGKKIMVSHMTGAEDHDWLKRFKQLFQ
jgi:iron(III) transport system substrate-binding protein